MENPLSLSLVPIWWTAPKGVAGETLKGSGWTLRCNNQEFFFIHKPIQLATDLRFPVSKKGYISHLFRAVMNHCLLKPLPERVESKVKTCSQPKQRPVSFNGGNATQFPWKQCNVPDSFSIRKGNSHIVVLLWLLKARVRGFSISLQTVIALLAYYVYWLVPLPLQIYGEKIWT